MFLKTTKPFCLKHTHIHAYVYRPYAGCIVSNNLLTNKMIPDSVPLHNIWGKFSNISSEKAYCVEFVNGNCRKTGVCTYKYVFLFLCHYVTEAVCGFTFPRLSGWSDVNAK